MSRIGFIGLGMMGVPMAHLLHERGNEVVVQDVDTEATARFAKAHPRSSVANSPSDYDSVEVLITMLPNSAIVNEVMNPLIGVLPKSCVVIDMSSSDPMQTRALAKRLSDVDIQMIDAPVSGGVKKAVDGSLAIMVGGDNDTFAKVRPVLESLGKSITHVGPIGSGHALKSLNNYVSAAALIATAEAIHAGVAFGIDAKTVVDVINASTGKNNTTENKAHQFMLSGAFNSGFSLALQNKDVSIAIGLGQALDQKMELGSKVKEMTHAASAALGARADHTELYRYVEPGN